MSYRTNLTTHIENARRQVLEHEADTLARETGFVQRQRKLTGSTFAHLMLCGAASNPCPTDTDWTQAAAVAGATLTPQAIEQRFTPEAAHFLYALLQRLVACVITTSTPEVAPLLQRFAGVFIKDSTVITLPRALASVWQGLGDSKGASAAVKLQVRWNFRSGQLEGPALQPARCHDRTTPYGIDDLPAGSVELADLGYFCLEALQAKQALGQYFVRLWKSSFRVDECRSRNVWRVWCALYAKLMGVVVWHWLLLVCRGGVWDRSLYKASCAFRRLSVVLCVCLRCDGSLERVVGLFELCLATCRVGKRWRRPATFQLILESEGLT